MLQPNNMPKLLCFNNQVGDDILKAQSSCCCVNIYSNVKGSKNLKINYMLIGGNVWVRIKGTRGLLKNLWYHLPL